MTVVDPGTDLCSARWTGGPDRGAAPVGDTTSLGTVVFLHAHPDDEAIFTGGTLALLSQSGARTVVVVATSGELGDDPVGDGSDPGSGDGIDRAGSGLAARRERETTRACGELGVDRLEFLRYRDSGLAGDPANGAAQAFATCDLDVAAARVARVLVEERAAAVVVYDAGGIYGHPDHVRVHLVGRLAARMAGVPTVYEATVDREYLHFVETHVVDLAHRAAPIDGALGVPTVDVTTEVDVRSVLDAKRAAVAVHASQIPGSSDMLTMARPTFAAVYGYEWYVRQGPPGPLDELVRS